MKQICIEEIGPRDGFQSVKEMIPTQLKLEIIDGLVSAGIKRVQCTSFVRAIPQMADARQVVEAVLAKYPSVGFFALVPNYHGAKAAVEAGLSEISPVISLSEAHNKANVNRTHEESYVELQRIRQDFPDLTITQDIATVFGCPFAGEMTVDALLTMIGRVTQIGIDRVTLCDTIGVAYPAQVREVITAVRAAYPALPLSIHIHDTRNMGVLNSYTAVQCGVDHVQTAVGGLGGCPFAPGATGNTSTEDLVYLLQKEGYETGIDFDALLATAKLAQENISGNFSGHHINITTKQCGFN